MKIYWNWSLVYIKQGDFWKNFNNMFIFAVSINFKNNYIMKKIILLLLLVLVSITASARKSYIEVRYCTTSNPSSTFYQMTGDVPKGIELFHYNEEGTAVRFNGKIGRLLNILSEFGYEVEFTTGNDGYLLSKEIPSNQTQIKGDVNTDGEVTIADVNEVIYLILGIVREHPEILEQYGVVLPK